ncbi:anthranilate synthase component I, N-terminal domain protein [Schaalia georgiae F0490]|uniref:Anthranilate synthase component 1 n=2 Tax=Schaalia georgiae TaxID=52768 RepID=J1HFK8_9ACTO|nr:anthranilate synthase component I, N-terminal domain protein [Schaalia georgiae F0490]
MRHGGPPGGVDDTMIGVTSPSKSTSDNPPGVDLQWGQTWPDRQEFRRLAATRRVVPVVRRVLADELSAVGVYRQLAHGSHGSFILESAEHGGAWGRWSFVGASSAGAIVSSGGRARWVGARPEGAVAQGAFLEVAHSALAELQAPPIPGLPPLTGALVGSLGWGIIPEWEPTLGASSPRESDIPDAALCLATEVAAIDHRTGSVYLMAIAWNLNGTDEGVDGAYDSAVARVDAMTRQLAAPIGPAVLAADPGAERPAVRQRTPRAAFEASVDAAKRAIEDGEAFQIVVSQRLDVRTGAAGVDVYRVLRTINPSPYMYYLALPDGDGGQFEVVGSSPETLVRTQGRRVWTYPIAGSRPRGADGAQDRALAEELLQDPKELSEHVMLVDLARNDLSKVCDPATVEVSTLMEVKRFSHIQHISSTVTGILRPDADALDCLVAAFPAGTLSGAPKPRAIRLIDELEPAARGVYGGVVGYFDLGGDADLAIAIRTAALRGGIASVQAGAGLVADSVPSLEYEESRNKAAAALEAVTTASVLRPWSSL